MKGISGKEFNKVSQLSHSGWGLIVAFVTLEFLGLRSLAITVPLWVGLTAWKEFYYDYKHETAVVRGSSLEDFLFYQAGFVVGFWLYVLHGALHG